MKKNFIVLAIAIMAILTIMPIVNALEFDNIVSYDKDNVKLVTIENAFGLGEDLAKISLDTPLENYVIAGKNRQVMQFTIENLGEETYLEGIGDMEIKNMRTGSIETKPYHFEKAIYEEITIKDYEELCVDGTSLAGIKGITCRQVEKGSHIEQKIIGWEDFNGKEIEKGNITLSLIVDVKNGDYYDGIPEIFGVKIDGWATWTSGFNNKIVSYWTFNESAGGTKYEDSLHRYNLTVVETNATTGKIANAFDVEGGDSVTKLLNFTGESGITLNVWLKRTTNIGSMCLACYGTLGAEGQFGFFRFGNTQLGVETYTGGGTHDTSAIEMPTNEWQMMTVMINSSTAGIYQNGTRVGTTNGLGTFSVTDALSLFSNNGGTEKVASLHFDEFGIWNRTLTDTELTNLYNSGSGITYDGGAIDRTNVSITYPINGATYLTAPTILNYTVSPDATDCRYSTNGGATNISVACGTNATGLTPNLGNNTWMVYANNTGNGLNVSYSTFTFSDFANTAMSYNASTFETYLENFNINITYDSSHFTSSNVKLFYNYTAYTTTSSGTGDNRIFTKSALDIPLTAKQSQENRTFYWQIGLTNTSGTYYSNSSLYNQTANFINISLCGAPHSQKFLNYTFKNELDGNPVNATLENAWIYFVTGGSGSIYRSNTYKSTSELNSYSFCTLPAHINVTVKGTSTYAASGWPQREYSIDRSLTNTTTNLTLYLLGSGSGIYTTFQVLTQAGTPISGVNTTAKKQISGVWTTIGSGTTGSDGAVTFWVDSTKSHRFTFVKTGYSDLVTTITPTQSQYTVYMGETTNVSQTVYNFFRGITYSIAPSNNSLTSGMSYTFNFSIRSTYWGLTDYGFTMKDEDGISITTATGAIATGSDVLATVNVSSNSSVSMNYYWNIGGNYTNGTKTWVIYVDADRDVGLKKFFQHLKTYTDEEIFGLNVFARTLIIFVLIFVAIGFISYSSGIYSPSAIVAELLAFVWFFNYLDLLPHGTAAQYTPTILVFLLAIVIWWRDATT